MPDEEKSKEEFDYDALVEAEVLAGELKADIEVESSFEINEQRKAQIEAWRKEQDAKVAHMQQESGWRKDDGYMQAKLRRGIPYYGVSGGALTYKFTPTGIGTFLNVYHQVTQETLALGCDDDGPDYTDVMTPWSPPPNWAEAAELEDEDDKD